VTTSAAGLLSANMYAYCQNDPVNSADPTGHCPWHQFEDGESQRKKREVGCTVGDPPPPPPPAREDVIRNNNPGVTVIALNGGINFVFIFLGAAPRDIEGLMEGDVVVSDLRGARDPNIGLRDSFVITEDALMGEIVDILLEYHRTHPQPAGQTPWVRTRESMLREWRAHNDYHASFLSEIYGRPNAAGVDFNNADENNVIYRLW